MSTKGITIERYQLTSREAWEAVRDSFGPVDLKITAAIEAHGAMTSWQIEERIGECHQTVSAQISHMLEKNILRRTGERGPTARRPTGAWKVDIAKLF